MNEIRRRIGQTPCCMPNDILTIPEIPDNRIPSSPPSLYLFFCLQYLAGVGGQCRESYRLSGAAEL